MTAPRPPGARQLASVASPATVNAGAITHRWLTAVGRQALEEYRTAGDQPEETRAAWEEAVAILDDLHHSDAVQVRAKLAGLAVAPR